MTDAAFRVVIGGGGVSGLATAYRLLRAGRTRDGRRVEVTLLEGRDRLGGNVRTERHEGYVIDGGPDAWVTAKPHASALARELGLGDRLIGTTPENRRVLVLDRGRVHPFPEGMLLTVPTQVWPFLRTRLLSPAGKARAGLDLVLPRRAGEADESIASFVRRRFGDEVLRKIGAPLLGGVFAGDVEALSIRATFPQLVELERKHRSLVLGARREMRARAAARKGGPAPSVFHSLPGGVGELIEALAKAVTDAGGKIATGTRVTRVEAGPAGGGAGGAGEGGAGGAGQAAAGAGGARWRVRAEGPGGESILDADCVVLAMPGHAAAGLLREIDRDMAGDLAAVPYVSSVVVGLAYPRDRVAHKLNSTGVITTDKHDQPIMAVTFLSSKWAGRAPEGGALFRVFMGGAGREETLAMSDATLISIAEKELGKLVGTSGAPLFARVYRHERASAQPVLGHEQRVARVRAKEKAHPGLFVVGAAMDGVGIPDCIRQATDLAKRVLEG